MIRYAENGLKVVRTLRKWRGYGRDLTQQSPDFTSRPSGFLAQTADGEFCARMSSFEHLRDAGTNQDFRVRQIRLPNLSVPVDSDDTLVAALCFCDQFD